MNGRADKAVAVLAILLAAGAGAARARQRPSDPPPPGATAANDDVVVIGQRNRAARIARDVRAISATHAGQLPRFAQPICVELRGLPEAAAGIVRRRVREVATRVGLATQEDGCRPDLVIVVAADGAAFVDRLRRRRPGLFDSLSVAEMGRLRRSPGPVWTWQSVMPRRRDGGPVDVIGQIQIGNGAPRPVAKGSYVVPNAAMSRLTLPVRQDIELAFVVFQAARIEGLTLTQVADYAATAGLAAVRVGAVDALSHASILTLFDDRAEGRDAAPTLTRFDLAYLRGLYAGDPGVSSEQRTTEIAHRVDRDLSRDPAN